MKGGGKDYFTNRRFTDQYSDDIMRIVGPLLLRPAPLIKDLKQATDFVVFNAGKDFSLAARVRRPEYFGAHRTEFTVRYALPNDIETELAKIEKGFGTWMFYGFGAER